MKDVDHKEIAKTVIENRRKFTAESYVELATAVQAAGGEMVHASVDDGPQWDWSGTGRFPWPPKNIDKLLELLAKLGGRGGVIVNGQPTPESFDIVFSRDHRR